MATTTTYEESLLDKAQAVAEDKPNSYIVIDAASHRVLGTGADPSKLFEKVAKNLKEGEIPFIYKKVKRGQTLIL
jgi:hypothetical protein